MSRAQGGRRRPGTGYASGNMREGLETEAPWLALAGMGKRASQALGQNFLRDPDVARRIVAAAALTASDVVLEVGPGLGALTGLLLETGSRVYGVEKDAALAARLRERYQGEARLTVLEADAMRLDLAEIPGVAAHRVVVANLPYYIAVPLVFRFLTLPATFRELIVMVQLEVAERMCASPGSAEYGAMTVHLQRLSAVSTVIDVPPEAFFPIPKVSSRVVRVVPHPERLGDPGSESVFGRAVDAAFAQRRKTLRNALRGMGVAVEELERLLASLGIDGRRRGETLSWEEFCRISRAIVLVERAAAE